MKTPGQVAVDTFQQMDAAKDFSGPSIIKHITEAIHVYNNQGPTRVDFADWIKKNAHMIDGQYVLNRNPGQAMTSQELNHIFILECFK